ncbi:hypothetical protein BJF79_14010 [Actinomadura sp. CNU-125]|nr:hypothetical protein BJF79_14010 [Actinomadura sp. CNU-125]
MPDSRFQTPGAGPVFGLAPEWLIADGRVVPASIVLSHPEQLDRLVRDCPEAGPAAVVAGDPCLDRMLAALPYRDRYRPAFGAEPRQTHVVVSSTWGPRSLLGEHPDLIADLLAELPMDRFRVTAVLHPNIWHGHGPWQVRAWLAHCLRAGLNLVPPREGWRAALVAADLVIGDHGSVTFYGAALGRPVLTAAFPHEDVDPASPVARLGRAAPALTPGRPLEPQVTRAVAEHDPARYAGIVGCATAVPGGSGRLLRTEMYRLMRLGEPAAPPAVLRVPPLDRGDLEGGRATAALTTVEWRDGVAVVTRVPAPTALHRGGAADGRHLAVDDTELEERLLGLADVVYGLHPGSEASTKEWLARTFDRHPGCHVAAVEESPGICVIGTNDGDMVRCRAERPELAASLVYGWLETGRRLAEIPAECTVEARPTSHSFRFG